MASRTGAQWRDLPERYGPWKTVYGRFRRWRIDSTFKRLLQRLQVRLDGEGRIDWDLWCIDGTSVRAMDGVSVARPVGRPRSRPERLAGDKGYSFPRIREWLRRRSIEAVIPRRKD